MRTWRRAVVVVATAVVVTGTASAVAVAAPAPGEPTATSFPSPGDSAASPGTSITLADVGPGAVTGVTATGSASGEHPGTLGALADGSGVVFDPGTDFAAGEVVTVVVSGVAVTGATGSRYSFTVATPGPPLDPAGLAPEQGGSVGAAAAPGACSAVRTTYVSRPDLGEVPGACTTGDPASADGNKILATSDRGAAMYDETGALVWFGEQQPGTLRYDLQRQVLDGRPVLTYYEGTSSLVPGSGVGEFHVLDESYNPIHTIRAGNGLRADVHDLTFTAEGHAVVGSYNPVVVNLAPFGGPLVQPVVDYVVQEVDVDTGQVYFEWHAVDHVDFRDSKFPRQLGVPWDFFHGNSVQKSQDGSYLVSSRHTSATYKIADTGETVWTLGGRSSDFGPLQAGRDVAPAEAAQPFCWQHFFRELPDGSYSLFDNGSAAGLSALSCGPARGLVMALVPPSGAAPGMATLTKVFHHDPDVFSQFAGSTEIRDDGGAFIGYGSAPTATLFGPDTAATLDVTLSTASYRTLLAPWSAVPSEAPVTVVDGGAAHASWNGATGVASWQLYAGAAGQELPVGDPVARTGFETTLPLAGAAGAASVVAVPLGPDGRPLAPSPTSLTGSTRLAGLGASGAVTGAVGPGTSLTLAPVDVGFRLLGIAPARATLAFEPNEDIPVTVGDGGATISFQASLRAADLTVGVLFSLSGLLGPTCTTAAPVTFTLAREGATGSTYSGSYEIPPFAGCAGTEGALSSVLSKPGNTLRLTLPTSP